MTQLPKFSFNCTHCGKFAYRSKKLAKNAGREISPGKHPSPYPCPVYQGFWHWGHMPPVVSRGIVPRTNLKSKRKSPDVPE